jgi:DNA (cytosine-5)-methyltransferase 1
MPPSHDNIAVMPQTSTPQQSKKRSPRPDFTFQATSALSNDFAQSHPAKQIPRRSATQEDVALRHLKREWSKSITEEPTWDGYRPERPVLIADLHDFEIYISGDKARRYELIGLHHLEVPRAKKLAFDGSLRVGGEEHYVEDVKIQDYSIEGFGDVDDPTVVIYIQSVIASGDSTHDIWYRLNSPTRTYERHHTPFLWVAQLAKHALDFMDEQPAGSVGLETFRYDFQQWLTNRFRFTQYMEFKHWYHAIHDREDFRVTVNAYIEFLYQQAWNLPNSKALLTHPVWADCMVAGLTQIEKQDQKVTDTLATPDVYQCFKHMYFAKAIRAKNPAKAVRIRQRKRKTQLGFQTAHDPRPASAPLSQPYNRSLVQVGDVVAFNPRQSDKQQWTNADWEWLLHVHDIRLLSNGVQRLFGMYLYRPQETNIFTAKYPIQNELFFSDNCNCHDGELLSTDINGRHNIEWTPSVIPTQAFFVRQTYLTQDSSFVTYAEKDKICECRKAKTTPFERYNRGDIIHVIKTLNGRNFLEPAIVHQKDMATGSFITRRLARLLRDFPEQAKHIQRKDRVARNELVLTDDYEEIKVSRIERRCNVRFIPKCNIVQARVPFPYNRGGAGDYWFFSMGLSVKDGIAHLIYLARPPNNFNEAKDIVPQPGANKLLGMSLFGGGGNLDRGVEEGGAVEIRTTVEWDDAAIHTQRANTRDPSNKMLWYGSVDDHLNTALNGREHPLLAHIGDVNIIIAGSPCPGFSTLQQDIKSDKSIKNASHITTICSYVDLFRPEYAVLENVVSMSAKRQEFEKDQNVLSQLVACFVSMGYQVNQFIMDAWNYGSCQQRSRLILTIAAPGLDLIGQPKHTHSMSAEDTKGRSLGVLPNRQRFGEREHYPTPFPHLTAGEVMADLPDIGNANVQTCISHPSHRASMQPSGIIRALLECIPREPPGQGYKQAYERGLIPSSLQKPGKETGRAFRRIEESGLVATLCTILCIQDSRNGATVHWSQDRPITILEARRTQGYLDNEPIIGNLGAQYRIIGNGVDRKVAFALGLAIRQAVGDKWDAFVSREVTEPKEGVIFDLEDDVEHFSDATSTSSIVQVYAPPSNRATTQSSTPARPSGYLERRASSASSDLIEIPGFDGTSDPQDVEPEAPASMATTGFLSRMSTTILGGLNALAYRSLPGLDTQETIQPAPQEPTPLPIKRTQAAPTLPDSIDETTPGKRTRQSAEAPTHATASDTRTPKPKPTDAEPSQKKRRTTRHSGLEAAFAPKQWNKRPEKEYKGKE